MAILCPQGHESSELDFCSECGAKIQSSLKSAPPRLGSGTLCPDCGAPNAPGTSNFCEVCGYNFVTGAHGEIPFVETPAPPPASADPEPGKPVVGWTLAISVDPSLRDEGSPPAPTGTTPVQLTVRKPVNLMGRTSQTRAIHPEIPLDDDGAVSHRHAVINRLDDGSLILRDIGSTNGTRLNGHDASPMTDLPLHDGDEITLGHWTRITLRAIH